MAQLINIDKSEYINRNIEIYAQNKIGQYSKFLNKNPIYVTYFSINQAMSRVDAGIGSYQSEIGEHSPLRFNKVLEFPTYNFPEIKPDIVFDESGYDIELDLSGITLLPNTIKPSVADYILLKLPGVEQELLFRVNSVAYNTIQSNDFYQIDLDIKDMGVNLEGKITGQIVETYKTIFDNIGTQDKCFIKIEDLDKIKAIVKTYNELSNIYKNIFYNKECNSFVLYNNEKYPGNWLYDTCLTKFIMDTNIYFQQNDPNSILLTHNDIISLDLDDMFSKTLLGAVYNRSIDYLESNIYYYQIQVSKPFSPFIINNYPCNSIKLYFSPIELSPDISDIVNGYLGEYYSIQLIKDIKNKTLTSEDYLDTIIFNYLTGQTMTVDKDILVHYGFKNDLRTFMYLPVILFIIHQFYDEYFKKS